MSCPAYALVKGDYVLIGEDEVIVHHTDDQDDFIVVTGECVNRPDSEYRAELDPFLEVEFITD